MLNKALILFVICFSFSAVAEEYVVKNVDEDLHVHLQSEQVVNLAAIVVPKSVRAKAVSFLNDVLVDRKIVMKNAYKNRYGNLEGYVFANGKLLQNELIRQGLAYVYSLNDDDKYMKKMQEFEHIAMSSKAGIWAKDVAFFSALDKKQMLENKGEFALIFGTVLEVKKVRDKLFINFEKDWKTDFTVIIKKEHWKKFDENFLRGLPGRKIRVRGWLESYYGPLLEIYNMVQIERGIW